MKIARIEAIKESRDNVQRVVTLTYHNVSKNRNGKWVGTPITVDRSVKDLILVDDALNESMLNPRTQENKIDNEDEPQDNEMKKDEKQDKRTEGSTNEENETIEDEFNDDVDDKRNDLNRKRQETRYCR